MPAVRYGPRDLAAIRKSRQAAAQLPDVWSTGIHAVWETDPDAVAAVLPPPLKPASRPLVRATINQVDMSGLGGAGHGATPLGAAAISVACVHGDQEGWYCLVMPMTTERALIGGREVFGEPKKLGDVSVTRTGDEVVGRVSRHGVRFVEVRGLIVEELTPPPPYRKLDFYLKFLPAVDGDGFDADPVLVHCVRTEKTRLLHRVEGEVILRDSDFDPVADLPVVKLVEITFGEKTSDQRGTVVARLDPQTVLPYIHQRYDDPAQIHDSVELPGVPRAAAASRPAEA